MQKKSIPQISVWKEVPFLFPYSLKKVRLYIVCQWCYHVIDNENELVIFCAYGLSFFWSLNIEYIWWYLAAGHKYWTKVKTSYNNRKIDLKVEKVEFIFQSAKWYETTLLREIKFVCSRNTLMVTNTMYFERILKLQFNNQLRNMTMIAINMTL